MNYIATFASRAAVQPSTNGPGRAVVPRHQPSWTPNISITKRPSKAPRPAVPQSDRGAQVEPPAVENRSLPGPPQISPTGPSVPRQSPGRPAPARQFASPAAVDKKPSLPPAGNQPIPTHAAVPFEPAENPRAKPSPAVLPLVQPRLETRLEEASASLKVEMSVPTNPAEIEVKPVTRQILKPQINQPGVVVSAPPPAIRNPDAATRETTSIKSPGLPELPKSILMALHPKPEAPSPEPAPPPLLRPLSAAPPPAAIQKEREPRITVNIEAIEIRNREPGPPPVAAALPPAKAAIAPAGFESHAGLRSYAPWPI